MTTGCHSAESLTTAMSRGSTVWRGIGPPSKDTVALQPSGSTYPSSKTNTGCPSERSHHPSVSTMRATGGSRCSRSFATTSAALRAPRARNPTTSARVGPACGGERVVDAGAQEGVESTGDSAKTRPIDPWGGFPGAPRRQAVPLGGTAGTTPGLHKRPMTTAPRWPDHAPQHRLARADPTQKKHGIFAPHEPEFVIYGNLNHRSGYVLLLLSLPW
jgi:hypothetical protein